MIINGIPNFGISLDSVFINLSIFSNPLKILIALDTVLCDKSSKSKFSVSIRLFRGVRVILDGLQLVMFSARPQ